jgi:hypothetical protein
MFLKESSSINHIPLYEVEELSVEEALLVLAAEKEILLQKVQESTLIHPPRTQLFAGRVAV